MKKEETKLWKGLRWLQQQKNRFFAAEEDHLALRYRSLYGEEKVEGILDQHRKTRRQQGWLFLLLAVVLLGYQIYADGRVPGVQVQDGYIVAVERPAEGSSSRTVEAKVYLLSDAGSLMHSESLSIKSLNTGSTAATATGEEEEETAEESLLRQLEEAIQSLNTDRTSATVVLPTQLEDGTKLAWVLESSSRWPLVLIFLGLVGFVFYKNRFAKVEALEKQARASIVKELPEFINRLLLLLNAGVVLDVAFATVLEGMTEDTYFAGQMRQIHERSQQTRSSYTEEFQAFALRSGVREFLRISSILGDNVERGADLVEKLRMESSLLWFERKKQSEEKGRLAETKLTIPLAILLLVLVLVTVSPAILGL